MLIDCPSCARSYDVSREAIGETGRNVVCQFCDTRWFVQPPEMAAPGLEPGETGADDAVTGRAPVTGTAPVAADASLPEVPVPAERTAESEEAAGAPGLEGMTAPSLDAIEIGAPDSRIFPDERSWRPEERKPVAPRHGRIRADRTRTVNPLHAPRRAAPRRAGIFRQAVAIAACIGLAMGVIAKRNAIVHALPATGALYAAVGLPVNIRGLEFSQVATIRPDAGGSSVEVSGTIHNVAHHRVSVPRLTFDIRNPSGAVLASWTENAPRHSLGSGESITFTAKTASLPEGYKDVAVHFSDEPPVKNLRETVAQVQTPVHPR